MTGPETETTAPHGLHVDPLSPDRIVAVLADIFGAERRRCAELDRFDLRTPEPGETQWLIAELGDGRITGICPAGEQRWHLERSRKDVPWLAADGADAWRILELTVFTTNAQIRVGEGAEEAHAARDSDDAETLDTWLRPRDRSLLLLGWTERDRYTRTVSEDPPVTRGRELSGSEALHPVRWTDFKAVRDKDAASGWESFHSIGTWLCVREYWAEDPATGAVHVAFHRLTGYQTGAKPTDPLVLGAPSALEPDPTEAEEAEASA